MKTRPHHRLLTLFLFTAFAATAMGVGQSPEKEWAWLIFMNGNNNLSQYTDLNLKQLESVVNDKVDVIVQWAKLENDKTYRLKVQKSTDPNKVTSPMVETMPRQDMGDYKTLVEFVRWSVQKYPAKRYFVSFWDHGSGWHRLDANGPVVREVNHDDHSGHKMTTEQVGTAIKEIAGIIGHRVDIVGMDACLMAMVEVGSEFADAADYMIASEELVPGLGWPYDKFYERWAAKPEASTAEITGMLVDEYHKYLGPKYEITMSAYHVAEFPALWDSLAALSSTITTRLPEDDLLTLRSETASAVAFAYADYVDMGSWLRKAAKAVPDALDKGIVKAVSDQLAKVIVANKTTKKYADADGIAFWVPATKSLLSTHAERYAKLEFAKQTHWNEVVDRLATLPVCKLRKGAQWVSEVTAFSSQYGESSWSAKQVIGACDTSSYGDNGTAWAPKANQGTDEWITVAFKAPVHATGAVIRETYGNGFVTQVEAIDTKGESHVVWKGEDKSAPGAVADFEIGWAKTDYLVKGLKVSLTTKKQPGTWTEIDSIQLLGTP